MALWTGKGERIWRPLIDPPSVLTNSFLDEHPKGFGLMQRDRSFSNYQDDGAFYERRPSIWVQPIGEWGPGAVQLVEIPTDDEIHDNIVAYWKPKRGGEGRRQPSKFAYKLYWQNDNPHPPTDVARVVATRIGRGGVPGKPAPTDKDSWKFVIDFMGGPLTGMEAALRHQAGRERLARQGQQSPMSSRWSAPSAGGRLSTSTRRARSRSICAASWGLTARR